MIKYVFLSLFFLAMILIGFLSRKKAGNINDFLLGGRNMGPWISAFSYGTAYFSSVIFIGYAGRLGYQFGLSVTWIGIGNALLGSLIPWLLLAKRTRRQTLEMNVSTMPEYFEKRYNSKAMKIVTALIIFVFLVPYSASVYQGLGYLFETALGIPYIYCMVAMALLTAIYLVLGGYVATAWNNLFQGIVMVAGIILLVCYILKNPAVGGLAQGISRLKAIDPDLVSMAGPMPFDLLSLVMLTSVGTWGLPQMVHKFYTIKDDGAIRKGTVISTVFALLIAGGAYFTGAFGRLFYGHNMAALPVNPDHIMPRVLLWALPEALFGLIIVLVLSASMSTLSSLVLVSSSSITIDLIKGCWFEKISEKKQMILLRLFCLIFVGVSLGVALYPNAILTLMSFSWGTVSGSFLAPFLLGLYWKKSTTLGAWAGIITGFLTSVAGVALWGFNPSRAPFIGSLAMALSLITMVLANLLPLGDKKRKLDCPGAVG